MIVHKITFRWVLTLLGLLLTSPCAAKVTFANASSSLAMDNTNAQLYVGNPAKITGWGQLSIVKAYGNNASSSWLEAYASNSVVGNAALSGVTKPARTNLVDANSNFVATLPAALVRTSSNLLLYTMRTYSSSLFVLRSRADSANITMVADSNMVNALGIGLRAPTADSIDGSLLVKYCANHYVFHNNGNAWNVRGWVRFNNGFTVMPLGSVLMDTLTTVSGGFDLRDTGTLILNNDLYLSGAVTLTNGGNIKGKASCSGAANTIFLGGDLTLASTTYARTLHITGDWSNSGTSGDLIIDGCGHTLNIGDRAQIFVDSNVTLTLRNMTIKTGPKSLNNPAIQLASHGSKLALDNVLFDLGADFQFKQGQIFVHDEVAVTGTSAFVYQSPKPSYITSGATWSFEQATTFSVAPSTFTDCPFTVNNTYTNDAFIVLADASSALSLNGCSLQTTFTGLRLRSGMVLFDNKVAIDTTAGVDLASTGTDPVAYVGGAAQSNQSRSIAWSPDSRFVAITDSSNKLTMYRINSTSAPTQVGSALTIGTAPEAVAWSPDGKFLAAVAWNGTSFRVYRFNGSSTPTTVGNAAPTGTNPKGLSWSPDGRFIAIVNQSSNTLQVYRFNGTSTPTAIDSTTPTGNTPYGVKWSSDGRFLAIINGSPDNTIQIYRFNGTSKPTPIGSPRATGTAPYRLNWSPDGRFVAVVNQSSNTLQIYRFYGNNSLVAVDNPATTGSGPAGVSWSPDGRFLAIGNLGSDTIQMYRFNGSNTPTLVTASTIALQNPFEIAWSPDGNYIAAADNSSPKGALRIFRCNYVYTGQPSQGFSNGLLFGDKRLGSAYDADVQVLGNTTVTVKGKVRDDSA